MYLCLYRVLIIVVSVIIINIIGRVLPGNQVLLFVLVLVSCDPD